MLRLSALLYHSQDLPRRAPAVRTVAVSRLFLSCHVAHSCAHVHSTQWPLCMLFTSQDLLSHSQDLLHWAPAVLFFRVICLRPFCGVADSCADAATGWQLSTLLCTSWP